MNHYVYLIEKRNALPNKEKYYIGVRSCEGKIGDDKYMGSSKYLAEDMLINEEKDYNKIILKRFNNREEAYDYEIEMHKKFDVVNNSFFFNKANQLTFGFGGGIKENNAWFGKKHSNEWKQNKKINMKGNKNAFGHKVSEEARKKIKEARAKQVFTQESIDKLKGRIPWNKGKTNCFQHTEEWKKKLSELHKGNKYNLGKEPWNKGKKLTEEHKKKLSEAKLGKTPWNKGKKLTEEHKQKVSEAKLKKYLEIKVKN